MDQPAVCPFCSTAAQAGSRFCPQCGTALAKRCGGCRAENPPAALYCCQCGGGFAKDAASRMAAGAAPEAAPGAASGSSADALPQANPLFEAMILEAIRMQSLPSDNAAGAAAAGTLPSAGRAPPPDAQPDAHADAELSAGGAGPDAAHTAAGNPWEEIPFPFTRERVQAALQEGSR